MTDKKTKECPFLFATNKSNDSICKKEFCALYDESLNKCGLIVSSFEKLSKIVTLNSSLQEIQK